jgi:hypothetical protein
MLTAGQKSRCLSLAQALDRGDYAAYKRAEPSLTPEMRGEVWDARMHVRAMAERAAQRQVSPQSAAKLPRPARVETDLRFADLDYWPEAASKDDLGPDDPGDFPDDNGAPDEPELEQKTRTCDVCRGSGVAPDGTHCSRCNGGGRIPIDPDDDPDDDLEDE